MTGDPHLGLLFGAIFNDINIKEHYESIDNKSHKEIQT